MANVHTGLVLKVITVKDYDAIITFLTADSGKMDVYAKGVFRPRSKRRVALEVLNYVNFTLSPSKAGAFGFLKEIKTLSPLSGLKNPVNQFAEVYLLAEILTKLTTAEENYGAILADITSTSSIDNKYSLLTFNYLLIRILNSLGYLPELDISIVNGDKLTSAMAILALPGQLGYAASTSNDEKDEQLIRIIKVQKYWLNELVSAGDAIKIALPKADLLRLTQLQLDWAEVTMEANLRSCFLLNSIIQSQYEHSRTS